MLGQTTGHRQADEAAEKSGDASITFPLSINLYQPYRLLVLLVQLVLGCPLRILVRPGFIGLLCPLYGLS